MARKPLPKEQERDKIRKSAVDKRPPATGKLYKAYFFRGADPAIAEVKEFIGNDADKVSLAIIEKDGGPAASTMYNWFRGKTKRPQNATIEAAGRALGMKRVWVSNRGNGRK